MTRKRPSRRVSRQTKVRTEPAHRSAWSWFEVGTTAGILSIYAALLTHPINLTVGDLGRHLKNGELVIQNGLIARANLFSYTESDYPFINHHWGSGALFYIIENISGFQGLSLAFVAISVATVWVFLNLAAKLSSFSIAAVLAVVCMPIWITRHEIRPEIFTYLLSGLFLQILWGYKNGRLQFRGLWFLPLLQVLWVNLHIYFFLGIVLVGILLFESVIKQLTPESSEPKKQSKQVVAVLLGTLLASCLNPAGVSGALYPLFIMQGYEFPVLENYSVPMVLRAGFNFLPLNYFLILAACLGLSWVYVFARDRSNVFYGNLLLSFIVIALAWWSIRNFGLFAYFALPLTAANLRNLANPRTISLWTRGRTSLILAGVSGFLFSISPIYFLGGGRGAFGIGLKEGNQAAAEFFRAEDLQGPVFNNFDVAGYLIYYFYPKERVFVDNRPEAYPAAFFRNEYFPLLQSETHWMRRSPEFGFNVVVLNHRDRSAATEQFIVRRVLDSAWAPVFFDRDLIILVKRYGSNQATIEKHELSKEQILARSS